MDKTSGSEPPAFPSVNGWQPLKIAADFNISETKRKHYKKMPVL